MKWKPEMLEQNLQTYIQMSVQDLAPQTDMIIWGETANPFVLSLQPQYLEQLLQAVPAGGYLVTGALDYVYDGEKWRPLNAMQALDGKGVAAAYGKSHLVPFGEYVPLRQYLPERLKTCNQRHRRLHARHRSFHRRPAANSARLASSFVTKSSFRPRLPIPHNVPNGCST